MLDPKKYSSKTYVHFDHRIRINNVESYVTDESKISVHSFLPLIHYTISFDKFNKKKYSEGTKFLDTKERDIKYAGHLDNYIYKYYSEKIQNDFYNQWCFDNKLDDCILAYRNNKPGQSNIHFAAEVINKIVEFQDAYVLVGDFTTYFDNINHMKLKKNIQILLKKEKLSSDWFNIFQSVTKYGYFELELLDKIFGTKKELKKKNKRSYFSQLSEFRSFKKEYKNELNCNKTEKGIPQGIAISATFANIYALDFDKYLNEIALSYNGIYRRYSDDFIIVVPKRYFKNKDEFLCIVDKIKIKAKEEKMDIQDSKTEVFEYSDRKIKNLSLSDKNHLDYLGFVFDGQIVQMRTKSTYKFYRKAKKLIIKAKKSKEKNNLTKLPYRKSIYRLYTDLGIDYNHGNFISYAKKSKEVFDYMSPSTNNIMMNQIKNRKRFIERNMGIKINIKI